MEKYDNGDIVAWIIMTQGIVDTTILATYLDIYCMENYGLTMIPKQKVYLFQFAYQ